jgi:threonine dehydrogenase-like Zn-dependent dehydrogenase
MELTGGAGVDVVIEAVGSPAAFDTCQAIVAAGGRIANISVHGKPVRLDLDKLWDRNIAEFFAVRGNILAPSKTTRSTDPPLVMIPSPRHAQPGGTPVAQPERNAH